MIVAACIREREISWGFFNYELCYSKAMESHEHILLLLFLYFDNTVNRKNTAFKQRDYIELGPSSKKDIACAEYNTISEQLLATWATPSASSH